MKRSTAVILSLLLIFCSVFVSAASAQSDQLFTNGDFEQGLDDWTVTTSNAEAGLKKDEAEPYVRVLADETTTSAQLVSPTVHIDADTKYELSFYIRVPDEAVFDASKASAPNFGIFEPSQKGTSGQTFSTYAEGQNNYAYSYASDFTFTRRMSFKSVWTVEGYEDTPVAVNGYSVFGAKLHYNTAEGIGVTPNEAYADWTKVTSVFTTVADEDNAAEADVAIGFVIKFPGGIMDIKNVSLKVWQEPPPAGPFAEADENGIKGGYVTQNGLNYEAIPYAGNEFLGWYDHNGNLVSKDDCVTAKLSSDYYGARFENSNLIIDSGFENYAAGSILFDSTLSEKQDWYVYNMQTATVLNGAKYSWVNAKVSGSVSRSGNKSMYGTNYHQTVATSVKPEKNKKYALSFWYCYQTSDENCYVNSITYGIYKPDAATNALQPAEGENTVSAVSNTKDFEPNQWKKASLVFTTGEDVEDLLFCYRYADANSAGESTINKTTLFVDDVVIMPYEKQIKSEITVETKTAASVTPVGSDFEDIVLEDTIQFKVVTEKGLTPSVTVDGDIISADDTGVYSFTAGVSNVIKVVCEGDEDRRNSKLDKYGNDLSKYNSGIYIKPVWEGNTVYHETVLFYTGRDTAKLLYPISEIISVRSYDLKTNYINGVDYEISEEGLIKRLEGSRIPVYEEALTKTPSNDIEKCYLTKADGSECAAFIGDTVYPAYAIAITYEHTSEWVGDEGYNTYPIKSQTDKLKRTMEKLENGEEVNILFFGDSASCGWSSSGLNNGGIYDDTNTEGNFKTNYVINVAPYAPTWMDMVINELKERYPNADITAKNLALGGKDSNWGRLYFEERLKLLGDWTPDLMILCFAGNDASGNMDNATYKNNFQSIINTLRSSEVKGGNPDAEVLIWSQNLPNTKILTYTPERFIGYEEQLESIAAENEGVALAKLTSAYVQVIKSKEAVDYLNTNVNHGNDFCTRMIAQAVLAAMTPKEYTPGDIDSSGEVDLNDVVTLAQYVAGWKGISYNEKALDTNASGEVDLSDVVHLAQYVAGWKDIILY